jgi:hypothetical protein
MDYVDRSTEQSGGSVDKSTAKRAASAAQSALLIAVRQWARVQRIGTEAQREEHARRLLEAAYVMDRALEHVAGGPWRSLLEAITCADLPEETREQGRETLAILEEVRHGS